MPCVEHGSKSNKKCISCFAADVVDLTLDATGELEKSELNKRLVELLERYDKLERSKEEDEYCRSVIFGLNTQLVARKLPIFGEKKVGALKVEQIGGEHRTNYRDRIRQMGTWIGLTELEVLAAELRIGFLVAIPIGVNRARCYPVGAGQGQQIADRALLWTGNHYEVATITAFGGGGQFTLSNVLPTNKHGDCAFESLLILLHLSPVIAGRVRGQWTAKTRIAVRQFSSLYQATGGGLVVDRNHADYTESIGDLRDMVATEMRDAEVNDAIIAEGELPGEEDEGSTETGSTSGGKDGDWKGYVQSWKKGFDLKKTVTVHNPRDRVTCVANIGAATDWWDMTNAIERYESWVAMKRAGLASHDGSPASDKLKHTGLMLAQLSTGSGDPYLFVCAAANYHQSWVGDDKPWTFDGNKTKVFGSGDDMHTERFCMVRLFEWITASEIVPKGKIDILWFLEKPMCEDGCVPVLNRFVAYWGSLGVAVNSVIFDSTPKWFTKNLPKALKPFTVLK